MKKITKILFTSFLSALLFLNSSVIFAMAQTEVHADTMTVRLQSEDITFQYISAVYNGREQKPAVTVKSGDTVLTLNTDYTVTYPDDCTNAGKKTVRINGKGNYIGRFSASYMITPIDCSDVNTAVDITIAKCSYSGMPLTPDVSVKVNGIALNSKDYSLAFSNNINATAEERAECTVTFRGNYSGSRKAEFDIAKMPSDDLFIELMVHNGDRVVYDLSPLLPEGASFGYVDYYSWDFAEFAYPRVAFNELSFTVSPTLNGGTTIYIPVINDPNREYFNIVFSPTVTSLPIPTVVIRPITREYNGEPIYADEFSKNGSYAHVNGKRIEGRWDFYWVDPPTLPCDKKPCIITFTPDDPQYCSVDTVVYVTISRKNADLFTVKPTRSEISVKQKGQFVISGIPEDYRGTVTFKYNGDEELVITETQCGDPTRREYEIEFPADSDRYSFTAELSGDSLYNPASSKCSITVGDYVPPEEKPSDKITTPEELSALIASAAEGGAVKAEGIRTIPTEIVKSAADKKLIMDITINENFTWIIDTAKLSPIRALDLDISTATIPAALLDKIGGKTLYSFNVYESSLKGASKLRVTVPDSKNKFANLFLYTTDGELKFISCAAIAADNTAELDIGTSGKYAVIVDSETKLQGDADNNGVLNVLDVVKIIDMILKNEIDPNKDFPKYDINNDKSVNVMDAVGFIDRIVNNI